MLCLNGFYLALPDPQSPALKREACPMGQRQDLLDYLGVHKVCIKLTSKPTWFEAAIRVY